MNLFHALHRILRLATVLALLAVLDAGPRLMPASAAGGNGQSDRARLGNAPAAEHGGTVTWTSSDPDPGIILPANYMFQPTDNGMVTFPGGVTLITPGNQTLTATDTVSGIIGSTTIMMGP